MFFLLSSSRFCPPLKNDGRGVLFCHNVLTCVCGNVNEFFYQADVICIIYFIISNKKAYLAGTSFLLEEQGKEAGTYDGHDAGYADGKGTHRAFYGSYFHSSCRAHPVGSRTEGNPFGYRVGDM